VFRQVKNCRNLRGFLSSYEGATTWRTKKVHEEEPTKYDGKKNHKFLQFPT